MIVADLIRSVAAETTDPEAAVQRIVAAIEADGALLRGWWDQYGEGHVRSLVAQLARSNGEKRSTGPHQVRSMVKARSTSWRDSLRGNPNLALEVTLPVNGQMVAIRDLTRRDIQFIEDGYRGIAHIATARAERWGRIRSRLSGPDDTVGAAVDDGRVGLSELISTNPGQALELTT